MKQQLRQDIDLRTFVINDITYHAVQIEEFPKYWATTSGHIISTCHNKPKVLADNVVRGGYLQIKLYEGKNVYRNVYVHRLVAEAFFEEPDDDRNGNPRNEVNHVNGITADNRTCNLEYTSRQENIDHCYQILPIIRDHFQGAAHASS